MDTGEVLFWLYDISKWGDKYQWRGHNTSQVHTKLCRNHQGSQGPHAGANEMYETSAILIRHTCTNWTALGNYFWKVCVQRPVHRTDIPLAQCQLKVGISVQSIMLMFWGSVRFFFQFQFWVKHVQFSKILINQHQDIDLVGSMLEDSLCCILKMWDIKLITVIVLAAWSAKSFPRIVYKSSVSIASSSLRCDFTFRIWQKRGFQLPTHLKLINEISMLSWYPMYLMLPPQLDEGHSRSRCELT